MSKYKDTIYALSTPTGKSAIAVIRISGEQSLNVLKKISSIKKIQPNKTKLTLLSFQKQIIDQVLVVFFKKPNSFTGEEMVEINCHGSNAIITKISRIVLANKREEYNLSEFVDSFNETKDELLNSFKNI